MVSSLVLWVLYASFYCDRRDCKGLNHSEMPRFRPIYISAISLSFVCLRIFERFQASRFETVPWQILLLNTLQCFFFTLELAVDLFSRDCSKSLTRIKSLQRKLFTATLQITYDNFAVLQCLVTCFELNLHPWMRQPPSDDGSLLRWSRDNIP